MTFPPLRPSRPVHLFTGCFLAFSLAGAAAADSEGPSPSKPVPDSSASVFAGGSFWCMEAALEAVPGVDSAVAGYAGGEGPDPGFDAVASGTTGFVEAVKVYYRPGRISYSKLLDVFWKNIDPTRADGQFSDVGAQYRTVLFYKDDSEKAAASASRRKLEASKRFSKPLVTEIAPLVAFHRAEAGHQDYYKKNPARYKAYVRFSGREAFFKKAWGASSGK
jgi:peptide methionine sulfoxide reductase msrA/msrB